MAENEKEWIEWAGGDRPVGPNVLVEIMTVAGILNGWDSYISTAEQLEWDLIGDGTDVAAYRVIDE